MGEFAHVSRELSRKAAESGMDDERSRPSRAQGRETLQEACGRRARVHISIQGRGARVEKCDVRSSYAVREESHARSSSIGENAV
jgi:hypothetical protein